VIKVFLAIIVCKWLRSVGKVFGRGSSLPGKIALKICPEVLSKVKLCENVVAITGSNGKTSTTELICDTLQKCEIDVVCNREGSNQIEGVTTLILCNCDLRGRFKKQAIVMETDERFARKIFEFFAPKYYIITNIFRDQLTRNRHPEWIFDVVKKSISKTTRLILNADDPLVSALGQGCENATYYSVDSNIFLGERIREIYDDGSFCPICKWPLRYEGRNFGTLGKFTCENCGNKSQHSSFTVTCVDAENKAVKISGDHGDEHVIKVQNLNPHSVYNVLAAFVACFHIGVEGDKLAGALSSHVSTSGRLTEFDFCGHRATLLISKHENPVSYDRSIEYALNQGQEVAVAIVVNKISRKYFTSETSWLWDINFEKLKAFKIKKIFLIGRYCYDLATRFDCAGVEGNKVFVEQDLERAREILEREAAGELFIITCFADKQDVMKIFGK
jgi:UDP-N-acetylmuramyl tripeptide synthase